MWNFWWILQMIHHIHQILQYRFGISQKLLLPKLLPFLLLFTILGTQANQITFAYLLFLSH